MEQHSDAKFEAVVDEVPTIFGHRTALAYSFQLQPSGEVCKLSVAVARTSAVGQCEDAATDPVTGELVPLYANYIWPGSIVLADYIQSHASLFAGKSVLELGAGTALAGMVASKAGARLVVATDYPEPTVLENMQMLVKSNACPNMIVEQHVWGNEPEMEKLLAHTEGQAGYDILLLAEVLWKDTYKLHDLLLKSVGRCLKRDGLVLLAVAHRPSEDHTPAKDMEFVDRAGSSLGLACTLLDSSSKYHDAIEKEPIEVRLYSLASNSSPST